MTPCDVVPASRKAWKVKIDNEGLVVLPKVSCRSQCDATTSDGARCWKREICTGRSSYYILLTYYVHYSILYDFLFEPIFELVQ